MIAQDWQVINIMNNTAEFAPSTAQVAVKDTQ